jgi:hypothetical protein
MLDSVALAPPGFYSGVSDRPRGKAFKGLPSDASCFASDFTKFIGSIGLHVVIENGDVIRRPQPIG